MMAPCDAYHLHALWHACALAALLACPVPASSRARHHTQPRGKEGVGLLRGAGTAAENAQADSHAAGLLSAGVRLPAALACCAPSLPSLVRFHLGAGLHASCAERQGRLVCASRRSNSCVKLSEGACRLAFFSDRALKWSLFGMPPARQTKPDLDRTIALVSKYTSTTLAQEGEERETRRSRPSSSRVYQRWSRSRT